MSDNPIKIFEITHISTNVLIIPLQMYVVIAPQLSEKFYPSKSAWTVSPVMSDIRNQVILVMGFNILEPTALGRGWRITQMKSVRQWHDDSTAVVPNVELLIQRREIQIM